MGVFRVFQKIPYPFFKNPPLFSFFKIKKRVYFFLKKGGGGRGFPKNGEVFYEKQEGFSKKGWGIFGKP